MSFYAKLLIFLIIVEGTIYLLRRFPDSAVSIFAFSWYGPVPNNKETLSHYMLRWALFAFKYGIIILILLLGGIFIGQETNPIIFENQYFQIFFLFAFPLLLGMAVLGGIGCLFKSVWYKFRRSDYIFSEESQNFINRISTGSI
jgi:hypothetical protein